jgi:hypothetical protein
MYTNTLEHKSVHVHINGRAHANAHLSKELVFLLARAENGHHDEMALLLGLDGIRCMRAERCVKQGNWLIKVVRIHRVSMLTIYIEAKVSVPEGVARLFRTLRLARRALGDGDAAYA